jgi:hypothetical protein
MPSEQIDANVHPSKTEVRFLKEAENIDAIAGKAAAAIEERVETRRRVAQSGPKAAPGAGPTKRWGICRSRAYSAVRASPPRRPHCHACRRRACPYRDPAHTAYRSLLRYYISAPARTKPRSLQVRL